MPHEPLAALDAAVYYLDRELAPAAKVRAFQRARAVVERVGPDEIRRRAADGTLTELDGIGPSTARVIAEALAGVDDGYLAELERRSRVPVGEGAGILAALRGDCHCHTTWSDGGADIATMARTARDLGHDWLVITDHSARLTVAHGLDEERLAAQLDEIASLNAELAPFRLLTGMEVDILADGTLDLADEMLARLDLVVASAHSKLAMPRDEMTRRLVRAVASPHVDVLGHCTNRKLTGRGRPPSDFDAEIVFAACARFDTAVEINCRPERQDPPEELLDLALEWGCKVSIDTDAHAPGQLEWQAYGADKAARCGVDLDDIVDTWDADTVCAWAASHAAG
ncbi:MAG: PHP domain-containing protein [Actinomyces sp.]|nr:MAG: PHP domain-containing protein [Actinomyces sp.]